MKQIRIETAWTLLWILNLRPCLHRVGFVFTSASEVNWTSWTWNDTPQSDFSDSIWNYPARWWEAWFNYPFLRTYRDSICFLFGIWIFFHLSAKVISWENQFFAQKSLFVFPSPSWSFLSPFLFVEFLVVLLRRTACTSLLRIFLFNEGSESIVRIWFWVILFRRWTVRGCLSLSKFFIFSKLTVQWPWTRDNFKVLIFQQFWDLFFLVNSWAKSIFPFWVVPIPTPTRELASNDHLLEIEPKIELRLIFQWQNFSHHSSVWFRFPLML